MVRIRTALPADLDAIREIYNYYIRTSTATFLEADCTPEEMTEKI